MVLKYSNIKLYNKGIMIFKLHVKQCWDASRTLHVSQRWQMLIYDGALVLWTYFKNCSILLDPTDSIRCTHIVIYTSIFYAHKINKKSKIYLYKYQTRLDKTMLVHVSVHTHIVYKKHTHVLMCFCFLYIGIFSNML